MEPLIIQPLTDFLAASGPYGLVAILGWAFWKTNEKKDAELKALSQKVLDMAAAQTAAITKVESALVALKKAIEDLANGGRSADI